MLANHQGQLRLALENRGRNVGKDHGVALPNYRVRRLVERVDRRRRVPCPVLHVVDGHRHNVARLGQRRPQPYLVHRRTLAAVGSLLQCISVLGEIGDYLVDQVLGRGVIDTGNRRAHVHHIPILYNAEFEVVEEYQLHAFPLRFD